MHPKKNLTKYDTWCFERKIERIYRFREALKETLKIKGREPLKRQVHRVKEVPIKVNRTSQIFNEWVYQETKQTWKKIRTKNKLENKFGTETGLETNIKERKGSQKYVIIKKEFQSIEFKFKTKSSLKRRLQSKQGFDYC